MLNKRCIDIIDYLKKNKFKLSVKETANLFDVSERCIRYDIENINYYLAKFDMNEIRKSSKGIYTLDESGEKIDILLKEMSKKFYIFTSEERKEYIEERFLFFKENKLIDFMDILNVSMSTIRIDLKEVKIFFLENELELNFFSKSDIYLQGNEEKVRMLQLKFFNKLFEINSENKLIIREKNRNSYLNELISKDLIQLYENIDLKNIYDFVKSVERDLKTIISDEAFNILRYYIIIMIKRKELGMNLNFKERNKKFLMETKEFSILKREITNFSDLFSKEMDESEVLLLTELFLGAHSYNFNSSFFENWIELETMVNKLIRELSEILRIDLTSDKALVDGLLNHLKPTYYRIRNNIDFENKLFSSVYNLYTDLYEKIEKISENYLEKYIGKTIPKEEVALLTIHFKTAIDRKVNSQKKTKNILIVCELGYGSSKLLAQKLVERYDVNIVDILPYHRFLEIEECDDIDFIITTLDMENTLEYNFPIIKVQPILTKEDKELLESYGISEQQRKISLKLLLNTIKEETEIKNETALIKRLKSILKHRYVDDLDKNNFYSLSQLLPIENIRILDEKLDWREGIKISSIPLLEKGYITDEYVFEMIKNVEINGNYMIINDIIALPHARTKKFVKQTGMSLLIFRDGIEFSGNKNIKILLTFSSIDGKEHIDALTDFITLVEDKKILDKILNLDLKEIKELIDNISG